MKTIEVVAAVIFDEQGRIFATQRGYGEWKDWWEFPGGKIEAGETPEEALRREISEELDTESSSVLFSVPLTTTTPPSTSPCIVSAALLLQPVSRFLSMKPLNGSRRLNYTPSAGYQPTNLSLPPSRQMNVYRF